MVVGNTPQISIIIRTKDEERFIAQTLRAISGQGIDLPFEVIVIDSGSTDGTVEIIRQFKTRVYAIDPSQFTYGRALNYGASLAKGEYLVNLSAHCVPIQSRWMSRLIDPISRNSHTAATYGRQVPLKGLNPIEERLLIAAFTPDENGKIKPPFSNSNCAIRRKIWEKYPFDEEASFAEDFIWSQALPSEYLIEYSPEAAVYHTHPLRLKYWARRSYENGVLVPYLKHRYGLEYPWANVDRDDSRALWKRVLEAIESYAAECSQTTRFLFANKYFSAIPILPSYLLVERYYYRKGLAEGEKRYGPAKRQA